MPIGPSIREQAADIGRVLMQGLGRSTNRQDFFRLLAEGLRGCFPFDRLCINIYDQEDEILTYFTAVEGTVARTLSPIRPADLSQTVAGRVIASRKPVIITDFPSQFPQGPHPIAEAGLSATMAFPLMLDDAIIATLHCSFQKEPKNLYEITNLLLELSPTVAVCVGAVFSLENFRREEHDFRMQPLAGEIICHSHVMRDIVRQADVAAKLNVPVLLLGETGTGKSLLAHYIHNASPRNKGRFVKVNCPSLPQTLFESELFGHVRGAFTGAVQKRAGRFELAHEGTLFLDEIGELTSEMQSKLLMVLEDSSFERLGDSTPLSVDVRIVAATNIAMDEALASGKFRRDLFYRLGACTLEMPPLRHRKEDIPLLAAAFAKDASRKMGMPAVKFAPAHMALLRSHDWPGNVRELLNAVVRISMKAALEKRMTLDMVERALQENGKYASPGSTGGGGVSSVDGGNRAASVTAGRLQDVERAHIRRVLERTGGVISGPRGAAAILGIPRTTLQHRMRKLGIDDVPNQKK
ncbi:MAG: sigma 54-interacting transcriptional regulator [Desulfovibrio sp.]|jgi:transcriptional regulator with GAF, ATPase, and Fis domain|nr:sigma 54-interacting transcriptional regulator [Desulfovibrio sp.]